MHVHLQCPQCRSHTHPSTDAAFGRALKRIAAEGPWYALGDGETWEDRIHACLTTDGERCPDCDVAFTVSEDTLAELSRELLAQW